MVRANCRKKVRVVRSNQLKWHFPIRILLDEIAVFQWEKNPEGGTSNFSFIIEIEWSEILMEVWLLSRLHEHIPTKRDSRERNWLESAKRSPGYVIVPSGGCTLICTQILTPHENERLDLKITLFWDPEKSSKEPIHLLHHRTTTTWGCIGFNPLGASWSWPFWPPTPGEKASCFWRCVGDAFGAELHRELQHLAVPLFFFWGDTQRVCGYFGQTQTWRGVFRGGPKRRGWIDERKVGPRDEKRRLSLRWGEFTPPKFHIAPKNRWLEDYLPIGFR